MTLTVREGSVIVTATTRDPGAVSALESARCGTLTVELGDGSSLPSRQNCASATTAESDLPATVSAWLAAVIAVAVVVVVVIAVVVVRRVRRNGSSEKTLAQGTLGAVRFSSSAADSEAQDGKVAFSNPMYSTNAQGDADAYVPEEEGYADLAPGEGEDEDGGYMEPSAMEAPGGGEGFDDDDDAHGGYLTTHGLEDDGGYMDVKGTHA